MKVIQVTFDEALLEQLDSHPSVKRHGRSAVLSDAVIDYLRRHERAEIDRSYAKGYGETGSLESEFRGGDREGVWPQDEHPATVPCDLASRFTRLDRRRRAVVPIWQRLLPLVSAAMVAPITPTARRLPSQLIVGTDGGLR